MSVLLWVPAALVGGYLIVGGIMALLQRRLLYERDMTIPDRVAAGLPEMQPVTLQTRDGLDLLAWWRPPAAGRPTLAYFHGNAGHLGLRSAKLRSYLDHGLGVLLPAWRGYSGNPGKPSESGLYADAHAALDFLDSQQVGTNQVVLYGESLGTAVAVRMASERGAAAVVLEAPFTSIVAVGQYHYPWLPVRSFLLDRFDCAARIEAIGVPLLIVHGEADPVVPVRFGRQLWAAAHEPKEAHFIAAANHGDLYEHGMAELVLDFIGRHVSR